jgi:DNA polymerase
MTVLSIDIETYSDIDLIRSGVYAYAASPSFEVLLFAYAYDDGPVELVDLASGERISREVLRDLLNPDVIKTAFNANFERTCLSAGRFGRLMPPEQWQCTAARALQLGLPTSLDGVARALQLEQQKDAAGKALINYFSKPCSPTKTNGQRTRNLPEHDPEKWQQFKDYCRQDVEVERAIKAALNRFAEPPEYERRLWCLDQHINDRGVGIDRDLVSRAVELDAEYQERLYTEAVQLTGLANPRSVAQLKQWLSDRGVTVDSLSKGKAKELLDTVDDTTRRVLELRLEMAKTSIKKYEAMERAVCPDGRARGLLQYYGANRTGRWAGRLIQLQNLPQNHLDDLDLARQLLRDGQYELIELLYESVPNTLSQLIRTAIVPAPGKRFIVADFSAIEARVIAWLAGEKWRMDVFNGHGKIYEASASQMFRVPIEEITKGHPLRQKGKIAELALGYQGSVGALEQMGALKMGLSADELPGLVTSWRVANPAIVRFWSDVEAAARKAVENRSVVNMQYGLQFSCHDHYLFIRLPSGRQLAYADPMLQPDRSYPKDKLTYMGYEQGKWTRLTTYGGRLAENIVQATARDCLAEALLRLDDAGYQTVFHVHDEVVMEVPNESSSLDLDEVMRIMGQPINWAPGLPLRADGFITDYYKKD